MGAKRESGQSIFEFILFLPIIVSLYLFLVNIGASINGSINQQKVTRAYFFSRLKNNSVFPTPIANSGGMPGNQSWSRFGMFFIGWKEKWASGGQYPLAPCYPLSLPMGKQEGDECNRWEKSTTQFIRPRAVFGVCGATFRTRGGVVERDTQVSDVAACLIE